jgi:hypothetical protein
LKNRQNALIKFYDNAYDIRKFADVIYGNKKINIVDFIDSNRFRSTLGRLIVAWKQQGTFNAYISFLKFVFGEQTIIHISIPSPATLHISISNFDKEYFYRFLDENRNLVRKTEDLDNRLATEIIKDVSINELIVFLNTLLPTDYFVEYEFEEN